MIKSILSFFSTAALTVSVAFPVMAATDSSFVNDFESYDESPGIGYFYESAAAPSQAPYINNADTYNGLASETAIIFQGDMYANQYVNNVLQKPAAYVYSASNNKYYNIISANQRIGGFEGYWGFNTRFIQKSQLRNSSVDGLKDMTVVKLGDGNKVLCLEPLNNKSLPNGYGSYFGNPDLELKEKVTVFEGKIRIDKDTEAIRLHIVKGYSNAKTSEGALGYFRQKWADNGYGDVNAIQFIKTNRAWFDALTIKDGVIYLGKAINQNEVCAYQSGNESGEGEWFTIRYMLNLLDLTNPKNSVEIITSQGETIGFKISDIVIDNTNKYTDNKDISSQLQAATNAFSFDAAETYGLMFSSVTGGVNQDYGTAYLDDLLFREAQPLALTNDSNQYLENPISYNGLPEININFNYDLELSTIEGNIKVIDVDSIEIPCTVTPNGKNIAIVFENGVLQPASIYKVQIAEGLKSLIGSNALAKEFVFKTRDAISNVHVSKNINNASGAMDLELSFVNNNSSPIKCLVAAKIKNENSPVDGSLYYKTVLAATGDTTTVSIENIVLPVDYAIKSYTVQVFVWNDFTSMSAYCDMIE